MKKMTMGKVGTKTGGRTKDPADKKKSGPMQGPGGMKMGKVRSTTKNGKYC
jgi:hypothetical protein